MNIEDRGIERNDFQLVANILVITSRGEWETMSLVQEDCMITKHSTLFKHPVCINSRFQFKSVLLRPALWTLDIAEAASSTALHFQLSTVDTGR